MVEGREDADLHLINDKQIMFIQINYENPAVKMPILRQERKKREEFLQVIGTQLKTQMFPQYHLKIGMVQR